MQVPTAENLFFKRATSSRGQLLKLVETALSLLIVANIVAFILSTVPAYSAKYGRLFYAFEIFSVLIFSFEYVFRLAFCVRETPFRHPIKGRLRFARTPLALIDLVAILPFYLPFLLPLDLRFLRILRLFRLFRVLKLARYSNSLRLIGRVIQVKLPAHRAGLQTASPRS